VDYFRIADQDKARWAADAKVSADDLVNGSSPSGG